MGIRLSPTFRALHLKKMSATYLGMGVILNLSCHYCSIEKSVSGIWIVKRDFPGLHMGDVYNIYLDKTVYSILPQSTQLQKWVPRQCLELVRYMLPTALEYLSGIEIVSTCVQARGGRSCEYLGGYKTINRIPLPLFLRTCCFLK